MKLSRSGVLETRKSRLSSKDLASILRCSFSSSHKSIWTIKVKKRGPNSWFLASMGQIEGSEIQNEGLMDCRGYLFIEDDSERLICPIQGFPTRRGSERVSRSLSQIEAWLANIEAEPEFLVSGSVGSI